MTTKNLRIFVIILMFINISLAMTQNISIAKDFYEHNLKEKALEEFILLYNSPNASPDIRSEALYYMGQITFEGGRFSTALNDWKKLIETFPASIKAIEIKDRLSQLNEVFSKSVDENISSSVAKSYIENGDFWSKSDNTFSIDGSWLPDVELAIEWYDKVILEFPNTYAAELAFKRKLFTILGWRELGEYGNSFGVQSDIKKYLPILLQTFVAFETSFPESSFLQGFRYQIAQVYWRNKDWSNATFWLNKIIDKSKGQPSFYSETAKARLNKIRY